MEKIAYISLLVSFNTMFLQVPESCLHNSLIFNKANSDFILTFVNQEGISNSEILDIEKRRAGEIFLDRKCFPGIHEILLTDYSFFASKLVTIKQGAFGS